MKRFALDALLFLFASPILLVRGCFRLRRQTRFWIVAYSTSLACVNCRSKISLVGMWKCGCGYTYTGHALRHCPVCASLPRTLRCVNCSVSRLLPEEA
jgi:hypothetical protein